MSRLGWKLANARAHARWLAPLAWRSLVDLLAPTPRRAGETHLILAIADHHEPDADRASSAQALDRVAHWVEHYPKTLGDFRDADGYAPRHTFFYPVEVYEPSHIDALAGLCRRGFGEVEIHLHHDGDTPDSLRAILSEAVDRLHRDHGLLGRHRDTGAVGYAFVHGNWALNNARSDGRWCGVDDEIRVLIETGCYADFTYPSAPSPTQPPMVNVPYRATSHAHRPRGHDRGVPVGSGRLAPADSLVLIPGPLALNWSERRKGVFPRLENACIQASQPATGARVESWLNARIRVPARPEWYFVKLHAHGATERDRDSLIGPAAARFHEALARRADADPKFLVHYVTAREMYNLVIAAESGWTGSVNDARDFVYHWAGRDVAPAPATTPHPRGVGA